MFKQLAEWKQANPERESITTSELDKFLPKDSIQREHMLHIMLTDWKFKEVPGEDGWDYLFPPGFKPVEQQSSNQDLVREAMDNCPENTDMVDHVKEATGLGVHSVRAHLSNLGWSKPVKSKEPSDQDRVREALGNASGTQYQELVEELAKATDLSVQSIHTHLRHIGYKRDRGESTRDQLKKALADAPLEELAEQEKLVDHLVKVTGLSPQAIHSHLYHIGCRKVSAYRLPR